MNADAVAALLNEGVEAFRLTREYVGEDLLPPLPGWSWFDWCEKAEAVLAAAPLPSDTPAETHCAAHATYFGGCDECERVASDTEARMASDTPADGLDAAWREAEAALPNDLDIRLTRRAAGGYTVELVTPEFRDGAFIRGEATPVEAFRAALALTQEPRSGADR